MRPFGQQQEYNYNPPSPFNSPPQTGRSPNTMNSPGAALFTCASPSYINSPLVGNQLMSPQQSHQQSPYQRQSTVMYNQNAPNYPSLSPQMSTHNASTLQRSSTFVLPRMLDGRTQYLWDIFQKVDADRSGSISVHELQAALVNGDWTPFNIETVRLMVSLFDTDDNGIIDFREFQGLWKYIEDWSRCFKQFDSDHSGSIDRTEMSHALRTFGFNVSDRFVSMLIQTFDKYGKGDITFDNFVQACVTLETLTKSFRARDYRNQGSVLINYEDFLTMIISSRPNMKGS